MVLSLLKENARNCVFSIAISFRCAIIKTVKGGTNMKYYERQVTKRVRINSYEKIGYKPYREMVKTNNIDVFNKGKRIKFEESKEARKYLYHLDQNKVYTEEVA